MTAENLQFAALGAAGLVPGLLVRIRPATAFERATWAGCPADGLRIVLDEDGTQQMHIEIADELPQACFVSSKRWQELLRTALRRKKMREQPKPPWFRGWPSDAQVQRHRRDGSGLWLAQTPDGLILGTLEDGMDAIIPNGAGREDARFEYGAEWAWAAVDAWGSPVEVRGAADEATGACPAHCTGLNPCAYCS